VSAGIATVAAIGALRSPPTAAPAAGSASSTSIAQAASLVPISLGVPGVAAALRPGDVVDLVAVTDSGAPRVVATDAVVVGRPGSSSVFSSGSSAVLLMSVPRGLAVALAATAATSELTAVIRQPSAGG
jgi:hypothetical protein